MAARARRPILHYSKASVLPRTAATSPPLRLVGAIGLVFVLLGLALLLFDAVSSPPTAPASGPTEYVVYAAFGVTADTVYRANAARPTERSRLFDVPHAREFGIVAAASPDGREFAYTVLPPTTLNPAPDTPAELWLAPLDGAAPRRLGEGFDLRVRPLWAPGGHTVIVRRSGPAGGGSASEDPFELVAVDATTGVQSVLVRSQAATFPAGITPDGRYLYFASVDTAGSELHRVDLAGFGAALVARLSDDLTRDWALSPDGSRLAFLTLTRDGSRFTSRVQVLDIATGELTAPGPRGDEFGPIWSADGSLTLGRAEAGGGSLLLGNTSSPARQGFDVPLAWSRSGTTVAVRAFDGASVNAPGLASLVVLTREGKRRLIANGEVIFIGWTYR